MKIYTLSFAALLSLSLVSCGGRKKNAPVPPAETRQFVMPSPPAVLTGQNERMNYIREHFWDNFDFTDTVYLRFPDVTERAVTEFVYSLPHMDTRKASKMIKNVLCKAEAEPSGRMYARFTELFDKYLHDPNSPFRNDEFYIPVTEYIIEDNSSDEADKYRAQHALDLMLKNRLGEPANDFTYTLANGRRGTLYSVKSDYILLMFHNPDCHQCEDVIRELSASPVLNAQQKSGALKILTFYPDKDLEIWKKHYDSLSPEWINGYDKEGVIHETQLYDLRAIPNIYLLDKDKTVIFKDMDITRLGQIEEYFLNRSTDSL